MHGAHSFTLGATQSTGLVASIRLHDEVQTGAAKLRLLASFFDAVLCHSSTADVAMPTFAKMARAGDLVVIHSKAYGFTSVPIKPKKTRSRYWKWT
jgi:hypothetical protein